MSDCPNCADFRHATRTMSELLGELKSQRDKDRVAAAATIAKLTTDLADAKRKLLYANRSLSIVREKNRKLRGDT